MGFLTCLIDFDPLVSDSSAVHNTSRSESPPRQRPRINPQPQLPRHLAGKAKSSRPAYNAALSWILNIETRERVRIAIDRLAAEALCAIPDYHRVQRYLEFEGDNRYDRGNSRIRVALNSFKVLLRFAILKMCLILQLVL